MNWSDFEIKGDNPPGEDHYILKPCLRILFYFQGSVLTAGGDIMHFYSRALPLIKQDSKYHLKPFKARYGSNGYMQLSKNNKKTFDYVEEYLAGKVGGVQFGILLETTDNPYGISDKALEIFHASCWDFGYVSLTLPVDYFGSDFEKCTALTHDLIADLPFKTGYVGYAVNVAFEDQRLRRYESSPFFHLSRNYLGVDFRLPYEFVRFENPMHSSHFDGKLTNVSWITYLHESYADAVQFPKDEGVKALTLPRGTGFRAAPSPSVLPVTDREAIEPYRSLAKQLKQFGLSKTMIERWDVIGGEMNTKWWMERFL